MASKQFTIELPLMKETKGTFVYGLERDDPEYEAAPMRGPIYIQREADIFTAGKKPPKRLSFTVARIKKED
jgi:hypothetical protein